MNQHARIGIGLLLLLALGAADLRAQSRVGTTAATFLTLGTGARGQSLGHAYTTLARGGDALFWNPAGAAIPYEGHRAAVFLTHHTWLADIDYNAAGVVIPAIGSGVLGLSLAVVDYGDMEVRTVALPEGTGETFSATDFSLGLTYAQPLTPSFFFGGTAKYVRQQIRDMAATAIAFDFGFILQTPYLQGAQISASIMNFGSKLRMEGINGQVFVDVDDNISGNNPNIPARLEMDDWDLPLSFKFGVALPLFEAGGLRFLALADANQSNDNNLNGDFGGMLHYGNRTLNLKLRAGYKDLFLDNVDSHATFGAGLDIRVTGVRFGFDYAYIPYDFLGDTQMVDFRLYF